jgi:hypothetical protein
VVELARARFNAREVWPFGSRVSGNYRPDSNWDILLLVMAASRRNYWTPWIFGMWGRDAGLISVVGAPVAILQPNGTVKACAGAVPAPPRHTEGLRLIRSYPAAAIDLVQTSYGRRRRANAVLPSIEADSIRADTLVSSASA